MNATGILAEGTPASVAQAVSKRTQLSRQEFFHVLTAQLTQQDPLKPMDSQDFLAQLVQLQNLEVTADLSNNFAALISQNAFTSAGSLLGKVVMGNDEAGSPVAGQVSGVSIEDGKVRLQVGAVRVSLDHVTEILNPTL